MNIGKCLAALFAILFSTTAFADAYLCIAEAAAFVEDGKGKSARSAIAEPSEFKFVLTKDSDEWVVKDLGDDYALLDSCDVSPEADVTHICTRSDGFAGAFMRTNDGKFAASKILSSAEIERWYVIKGRCSKI